MANKVLANSTAIAHKGTGAIIASFPDVCDTPMPVGIVPIPYPDVGTSSGTPKVAKKTKSSSRNMHKGGEAGAIGGVVSSKVRGKASYVQYSFDVKMRAGKLRSNLRALDQNIQNMPGSQPEKWHATLEAYVQMAAALYKTLESD